MLKPVASGRGFASRRGVAALEFALIAPVMAVFVVGVFDIAKGIILWQQVCNVSRTIPLSASTLSVQSDQTSSLTVAQVQQAMSSIYAEMPWVRDGIEIGQRSVTLSAVTFVPTPSTCVPTASTNCAPWTAAVAWSVAYLGGYNSAAGTNDSGFQSNQVTRSCASAPRQIAPTDPTGAPMASLRTLNVTQPEPILVADVHYRYQPLFLKFVTGAIDFWSAGYYPSRTTSSTQTPANQYTKYDIANQANGAGKCSGWP